MNCSEVRPHLLRYADGDLPPDERLALEDHLDHCYLCNEDLYEINKLTTACQKVLRHPHPVNRFEDIRPLLRPPVLHTTPPKHWWPGMRIALRTAACAATILVLLSIAKPISQVVRQWSALFEYKAPAWDHSFSAEPDLTATPTFAKWRERLEFFEAQAVTPMLPLQPPPAPAQTEPEASPEPEPESLSSTQPTPAADWMIV